MNQAVQLADPKGRFDVLVVRLVEAAIKAKLSAPAGSAVTVDLLHIGKQVCEHVGVKGFDSFRPELERLAKEYGVETSQSIPQLAANLGLVKTRKTRKRGKLCTR